MYKKLTSAAAQIGGTTVHNFLMLSADHVTNVAKYPAHRNRISRVTGIIVDEGMMAEQALLFKLAEVLQEIPLLDSLRRVAPHKALPLFGYRDMLICGDVRQLPPASGLQPFWGTDTFQRNFEMFVLREDRRHERDPAMRTIKEKLAWGGTIPAETVDPELPWPVDQDVKTFIEDGYLRGWGLTGQNVSLDVGVALFPRRADVNQWNKDAISQIEQKFGEGCEAVDVHGFDPQLNAMQKGVDKRSFAGIQTPEVLRLRTCLAHRLRVILLHNIDVGKSPHPRFNNPTLQKKKGH